MSLGINDTLFNEIYRSFHMPIFMFLSGIFAYNLFYKQPTILISDILKFFWKKTTRVVIPFISVGILYSVMGGGNPLDALLGNVGKLWFLPALFYCMVLGLIWIIICSCLCKKSCRNPMGELLIIIIIYILLVLLYFRGLRFPYYLHALKLFPYFILGAMFTRYKSVKHMISESAISYTISLIFFFIFLYLQWKRVIPVFILYTGLFAIIILIQLFKKYDRQVPLILQIIGTYSLEIYLFHYLFIPELKDVVFFQHIIGCNIIDENILLYFIIALLISVPVILFSILISFVIKQSKLLNFLFLGSYNK